jgi:cytochrome c-type protein NapC
MAALAQFLSKTWATLRQPSVKYSLLTLTAGGFVAGIVFWGSFNTVMEATNTKAFCISCHEMKDNVFKEYAPTIHASNRTGVSAACSDCHVPKDWTHKIIRKIQASKEVWHWALGTINTPEKFDGKRLELARHEWERMKATDSRECRNCHTFEGMNPEFQKPKARKAHMGAMEAGNTCIDCHKGIAHKNVRDQLADAELEELEKPLKEFARSIPASYREGIKRAEAREAAEAEKQKLAIAAAAESIANDKVAALKATLAEEAKVAAAKIAATMAAAPSEGGKPAPAAVAAVSASSAAAPAAGGFDFSGVEAKSVTLFYPATASFEWIQGRDHGGSRSFLRSGDRCLDCHSKEVADLGAKLVKHDKLEPTPIPDKRGSVDIKVQAAHDGDNLHLRFQWKAAAHTPAPFADGGKMDPTNAVKFSVTLAEAGAVERVGQAGCWASCHHDAKSMPDAPKGDALKSFDGKGLVEAVEGVRKYLADTRTAIELRGGPGKPRGGWDKVKDGAEIEALMAKGGLLDMMRFRSGEAAERGYVSADRVLKADGVKAEGKLEGDTWTVTMSRPLKASGPGQLGLEAGRIYVVNFALHDDHSNARYHHVSLAMNLGLDVAESEIVAKKK